MHFAPSALKSSSGRAHMTSPTAIAWQPPSSRGHRYKNAHNFVISDQTCLILQSRYYNLPTPVCLYLRFSFPLMHQKCPQVCISYGKYGPPSPSSKREMSTLKFLTTPAGRNRHYIDSHCIACESIIGHVVKGPCDMCMPNIKSLPLILSERCPR